MHWICFSDINLKSSTKNVDKDLYVVNDSFNVGSKSSTRQECQSYDYVPLPLASQYRPVTTPLPSRYSFRASVTERLHFWVNVKHRPPNVSDRPTNVTKRYIELT